MLAVGLVLGLALISGAALAQKDESSPDSDPGTDERAALIERWKERVVRRQELLQELAELNREMTANARELWPERFERGPRAFREPPRMSFRSVGPRGRRMHSPVPAPWHWDYSGPSEKTQND